MNNNMSSNNVVEEEWIQRCSNCNIECETVNGLCMGCMENEIYGPDEEFDNTRCGVCNQEVNLINGICATCRDNIDNDSDSDDSDDEEENINRCGICNDECAIGTNLCFECNNDVIEYNNPVNNINNAPEEYINSNAPYDPNVHNVNSNVQYNNEDDEANFFINHPNSCRLCFGAGPLVDGVVCQSCYDSNDNNTCIICGAGGNLLDDKCSECINNLDHMDAEERRVHLFFKYQKIFNNYSPVLIKCKDKIINQECPVCLDEKDCKTLFKCNHAMCECCYGKLRKLTCPLCREEKDNKYITHPISRLIQLYYMTENCYPFKEDNEKSFYEWYYEDVREDYYYGPKGSNHRYGTREYLFNIDTYIKEFINN
jgi:hypothetical protein